VKAQHVSSGIPLIIRSSKLYLQPLVYIHMWWPAVVQPGQRPVTTCVYKPEVANTFWSFWWWAVCHSKHVEPSINFGIINSITRLHLVGYFYWTILQCTDPWISNLEKVFANADFSVSTEATSKPALYGFYSLHTYHKYKHCYYQGFILKCSLYFK
jgi:hypothetical protein